MVPWIQTRNRGFYNGARILDFQAGRRGTREKEANSRREKMQVIFYDDYLDSRRVNIMNILDYEVGVYAMILFIEDVQQD